MEDSIEEGKKPEILDELWKLLAGMRAGYGQERIYRRGIAMVIGEIFNLGRHTVTQMLRSLGVVAEDWSAWYRMFSWGRFDEAELGGELVRETVTDVAETEPYVVTVDGVRIARSGKQVAGSSWWPAPNTAYFKRGLTRAQRFVEVAWLTPEEGSYCRAIPLRWLPAVTEKAVASSATPCKEWEAGLSSLHWVRGQLDRQGRANQRLVGVADGSYDTQGIWQDLPANTTLLIRCAKNRKLLAWKPAQLTGQRGRPRVYGPPLPTPQQALHPRRSLQTIQLTIRGRERVMRYKVVGPVVLETVPDCPLFLLVIGGHTWVRGQKRKYYTPAYYLVNALQINGTWHLPFPVATLLGWAWQRWECEVAHRDMKSALRIGDKQCWSQHAALAAVQFGVWVYALCVLAGYRAWGLTAGPRRQGRWYPHARRWSFSALRQAVQADLWQLADFHPLYLRSLDNWLKIDLWRTGLANALADSAYI